MFSEGFWDGREKMIPRNVYTRSCGGDTELDVNVDFVCSLIGKKLCSPSRSGIVV